MCPQDARVDDGPGAAQWAPGSGEIPEVCWGRDALTSRRGLSGMLSRRSAAVLGLVLVVALGAGIALAVRGSGSGSGAKPPLAQAAYVTSQAPGFQFALTITGSQGAQSLTFNGTGSIDERNVEGTINLQIAGRTISEIIKNPNVYMSVPGVAPGGKTWLKANFKALLQSAGASGPLGAGTGGPTQLLDLLKAGGQVTTVGEQSIRGVATTHYRALVDFSNYASVVPAAQRASVERYAAELQRVTGSTSLPIDVWLDSSQRVRRFSTQVQACTEQGPLTESISMDLFDYGPQPAVVAPGESEVTDITGPLSSVTSNVLAQSVC